MIWALIFLSGGIIFLSRYLFLEPRIPLRLSHNAKLFLRFSVPGMITAICGPIIFMPDNQLNLHWNNPYFLSSIVAVVLVLLTRSTLATVILSMAFFFTLRYVL